jgi:predicted transcriptional regulator
MQTVLNEISAVQQEKTHEILQIMADKYSRDILFITQDVPKSALKLAQETGIPISTVYRRMQKLHDNRLVRVSGEVTVEGKKHFLYQSKVKAIHAKVIGDFITVEIVPNHPTNSQAGW